MFNFDAKEVVYSFESISRDLKEFLYEGNVRDNKRRTHSNEELFKALDSIRELCLNEYNQNAMALGWFEDFDNLEDE